MEDVAKCVDASGMLLTENVMSAGISKEKLYNFIRDNSFERAAHGVYLAPDAWSDELYILHKRCSSGVLSHDEALYYHGLAEREPLHHTITVYSGYGTGKLTADGVKVFTVRKDLLEIGKIAVKTSFGHEIPMYDLERTVCDLVRSRNYFEAQDYLMALKSYAVRRDKDLNKLMTFAKLFHVDKRMREIMEVLL